MDTSLFPKRPDDFVSIAVTPVVCRPIMGGIDQFVVAALCEGKGERKLVRASVACSLRQLFPNDHQGILAAIDIGLTDLSDSASDPDFTADSYRSAVSSISLASPHLTEGSDLGAVGERWLLSMSSMHRPLSDDSQPPEESGIENLRQRIAELEALAEHPDPGLWRFWSRKAAEVVSKLQTTQDELRLSRATEAAALHMIGIDRPEQFKQGYVQETYAQEYLDVLADRGRLSVLKEFGLTEDK